MKIIRVTTVPLSLAKLLEGQLLFMKQNGFEIIAVSSKGNEISGLIEAEGCRHITIPMTRVISPFKDLVSIMRMYKLFRKEKPRIVHSHTPKAGMVAMFAAYFAGVPIRLHTVAGLPLMESKGAKRAILENVEKLTYFCATKIYPNSKNLEAFIIENSFCSKRKTQVLGNGGSNGINCEYYNLNNLIINQAEELKREFNIASDNFVFVFVGRLVKDKGIEELVKAFTLLEKKHSNVKLLLLGITEQELNPLNEYTISTIESNKNILKAGFRNDIRPFLALSHALVFPTYREGFPNVPMQAGCFHLPSIVTNINGCNEIIEDKKNGLIIPVKDEKALYAAMERLIVDEPLYASLKANARRMIVERYNQKYFWSLLLQEYQKQLKNYHVS